MPPGWMTHQQVEDLHQREDLKCRLREEDMGGGSPYTYLLELRNLITIKTRFHPSIQHPWAAGVLIL